MTEQTNIHVPDESVASLSDDELLALPRHYAALLRGVRDVALEGDARRMRLMLAKGAAEGHLTRDKFGNSHLLRSMQTAVAFCERVSPDRNIVAAILLHQLCRAGMTTEEQVASEWNEDVAKLVRGLQKATSLYTRGASVDSENFRRLLMTFAEDIRVIIIMIVDRLVLMRLVNHHPDERRVKDLAYEANYLYASLAHRLGLYSIKSDLEDMSLKYTDRETYTSIARQLNERKKERDLYIDAFISPVKEKLSQAGLTFDIKGRTKSIFSIWNKLRKQKTDIDHIYDLFAIRVIIDTPPEKEKSDCWMAYSLITDMYRP
ncbi:MAG: HD domain-containing protein, partial [Muribaculaceae bacterium]|nr:HD domain-containing protein [Muribaculaceae bacterium]